MNIENNHIDPYELIGKYLAGQANQEEISRLEDWVKEDTEHKKQFLEFKNLWIKSGVVKSESSIDLDTEWKNLESKLFDDSSKVRTLYRTVEKKNYRTIFRYAAILIVLIALSGILFFMLSKPKMNEITASNSVVTTLLPDGSEVTLNIGSKIIYPEKFSKDSRSIKLEGDAFFNVAPDKSKTFIIEAGGSTVKVLGTSFYLNAKADQPKTEVTVSSGKVSFVCGSEEIILVAGDKGIFDKEKGTLEKMTNEDENFISWKTRKLIFHEEKLESVIRKIEQTYGTKIQVATPEISDCRLTATFDNQSLDAVLEILKATFNLQIQKQNDHVIVSGNGCFE